MPLSPLAKRVVALALGLPALAGQHLKWFPADELASGPLTKRVMATALG